MLNYNLTKEFILNEYWDILGLKEPPKESESEENEEESLNK